MKGGKQTATQGPDPATAAYLQQVRGAALGAAAEPYQQYRGQTVAGVSDLSTGAAGQFQNASGLAGLGAAAIGGDPSAFGIFQNPYQHNVIDALGSQYDKLRSQAQLGTADMATKAGAFGGSRYGVALGSRLGALDQSQMQQTAQLQQQGFNDAQGRAFGAANLGLGAAGQAFGAGDYMRQVQQQYLTSLQDQFNQARDYPMRQLGILQGAMGGGGTVQSTPTSRNPIAGAAGGALQGLEVAGTPGAVIGGLGGLLFG